MRYIFETNAHKYFLYCKDCIRFQCIKCKGYLETCITCKILFCVLCDEEEIVTNYDGDTSYCRKHRELNTNDLYEYMVKMYDEKLTLNELREKILSI